jgi:hypothetical protein
MPRACCNRQIAFNLVVAALPTAGRRTSRPDATPSDQGLGIRGERPSPRGAPFSFLGRRAEPTALTIVKPGVPACAPTNGSKCASLFLKSPCTPSSLRDRVVHQVQVEGDHQRPQQSLQPFGESYVAVGDRGGGEHGRRMACRDDRSDTERQHNQPVDRRGDQERDRMVAHRGRYIDIGIGVMKRVQAPQERYRVLAAGTAYCNRSSSRKPATNAYRRTWPVAT